jgi:hypothetical protein
MNEFLLFAVVMVYLAISYSPMSRATKSIWQKYESKRSGHSAGEKHDQ